MAYLKGSSFVDGNLYINDALFVNSVVSSAGKIPIISKIGITQLINKDSLIKYSNEDGSIEYSGLVSKFIEETQAEQITSLGRSSLQVGLSKETIALSILDKTIEYYFKDFSLVNGSINVIGKNNALEVSVPSVTTIKNCEDVSIVLSDVENKKKIVLSSPSVEVNTKVNVFEIEDVELVLNKDKTGWVYKEIL